jgi:hypothetical protein
MRMFETRRGRVDQREQIGGIRVRLRIRAGGISPAFEDRDDRSRVE